MSTRHGTAPGRAQGLLDAAAVAEEFGVSVSRISELYRDRSTNGFPASQSEDGPRLWDRGDLDRWFSSRKPVTLLGDLDPDELLNATQVAQFLGVKSIHAYLARDGYFPAPDVTEETDGGYLKRKWRRGTVADWDAERPGKGNTQPKTNAVPQHAARVVADDLGDLLDSREAAALLGYASEESFASAFAQGILPGLEPQGTSAGTGRGRVGRLWPRAQVAGLAQQRHADAQQLRRRQEVCRAALAQGGPVSARDLAVRDPDGGTAEQWKASVDAERRRLKRG